MNNLKWVFHRASKRKLSFLTVILLLTLAAVGPIISIYLQRFLIDDVFIARQFEWLIPILLLLSVSMILSDLLYSAATYFQLKFTAVMRKLLTVEFMDKLNHASVEKLQKQRTGKFIENLTGDVNSAAGTVANSLPNGIKNFVELIVLIVIIGISAPFVLLLLLISSPFYIYFGRYFSPRLKSQSKMVKNERSKLISHIEEGVSGTREVIAFNRSKWERERFRSIFGSYFQAVMKGAKLGNKQLLFTDPIKWTAHLAVLGVGGYSVLYADLTIGVLMVVYQLSMRLIGSVERCYNFTTSFAGSFSSIERFEEALAEIKEDSAGDMELVEPVKQLRFENVHFKYSGKNENVFSGLTLDIPIGKKIALVGASGGGKSTIAQLLLQFVTPQKGQILVNGLPLERIKRQSWMKKISMVFQEPYLFPETIRSNLKLGRDVADESMEEMCERASIHEHIMDLNDRYDTLLGERGITFSGGQRQRLAIARTMLSESEIIILDEATSALDLNTEREVQRHIDEITQGKTTIIIAHRLSTIRNADLIFVFDKGSVVESGNHNELINKNGVYHSLLQAEHKRSLA